MESLFAMIIDAHARVSPTSYGSTEGYLAQLAQAGIRQGVVCPGGMVDVRNMNAYLNGSAKPEAIPKNGYVEQAVRFNSDLHGVVCVDPRDPRATDVAEGYLEKGFRGVLVSPLVHPFSFSDDGVRAVASLCGDHEVPLYSQVALTAGAHTADYARLASAFPRTSFILAHMGAGPVDREASAAAALLDNLFLETSLGTYLHILETVKEAGASKLVFGSEYPLSHPAVELQKIVSLPMYEGEREKILGNNIRELLRLG